MPPQVVLLGFRNDTQETAEFVSWPMSYMASLPEVPLVGLLLDSAQVDPEATNLRRVDITKALDRAATLFVFVGPGGQAAAGSSLGSWLLNLVLSPHGLSLTWGGPNDITSERAELRPFFEDQVAHSHLSGALPGSSTVLARVRPGGSDSLVASVSVQHGKAVVFLVPLRSAQGSEEAALRFIQLVPPEDAYPEYLDALDLGGEEEARTGLQRLQQQQVELEAQLEAARLAKRILYFKDMALQQEVGRFLDEELGVPARVVEGNHEDFHLLLEGGDEFWCIGEVKGRETANVKKADVNALTIHRSDAGLDDDFPSLLVVNTFQQRSSVESRDEPVHPDVIRRAAEDHVVVVRTLDLVRIKKTLRADNRKPLEAFLLAVETAGGWFEVDESGDHRRRTS